MSLQPKAKRLYFTIQMESILKNKIFIFIAYFFNGFFKLCGLAPVGQFKIACFFYSVVICISIVIFYMQSTSEIHASFQLRNSILAAYCSTFIKNSYPTMLIAVYLLNDKKRFISVNQTMLHQLSTLDRFFQDKDSKLTYHLIVYMLTSLSYIVLYNIVYIYRYNFSFGVLNANASILYLIPNTIIMISFEYYFGGMWLIVYYFKKLNQNIKEIIAKTRHLEKKILFKEESKYNFMQDFCDLSDKLDKLANFHQQLCDLTRNFSAVWSTRMLLNVIWRLFFLVLQPFMVFLAANKSVLSSRKFGLTLLIISCMLALQIWSAMKITCSCADVIRQVINRVVFS